MRYRRSRKIRPEKYLLAGLLTVLVFLLGTTLGLFIEEKRMDYLRNFYERESTELESLQLQYLIIMSGTNISKNCQGLKYAFNEYLENLEKKREKLEEYTRGSSSINKKDFEILTRQYLIAEVKSWLLARRIKEMCGADFVTLLNFHSKNCDKCEDQNIVLSYLKKKYGERLLIFSFNADYTEEGVVTLLKTNYNITNYPTLIIDDEKKEGFLPVEELEEIIKERLNNKTKI